MIVERLAGDQVIVEKLVRKSSGCRVIGWGSSGCRAIGWGSSDCREIS